MGGGVIPRLPDFLISVFYRYTISGNKRQKLPVWCVFYFLLGSNLIK